jgi:heat shock protein HtpX
MKRILLFLATNLAVLFVLSIVMQLVQAYLARQGVHFRYQELLVFAVVFGMGGSFISLGMSKWMALRATGAQVIEQPRGDAEAWLLQTVAHHAQAKGVGMPQVAIFPSDSPNAFATGARRDAALVAVSTGLLQRMNRDEIEAVLGHEMSHVANGDMVTLTLIQGVVNTFVLFLSRIIGDVVDRAVFRSERGRGPAYFLTVIVVQVVLTIVASLIVMWFSRQREFRADRGGAEVAGRGKMVAALKRLKSIMEPQPLPDQMAAFGISGGTRGGLARLFMTHPPLEERIRRLEQGV